MKNIITSRTPLRISLIGGGSDLESYYSNNEYGKVISTTIDKYIYIIAHKRYDNLIRASYSKTEVVKNVEDLNHNLIRETMKFLNINKGIEVVSISDVTAHGTGLGSSSSYTVGLLNALSKSYDKFNLANDACKIEIDYCKEPIGKQDQFAAAFGGLNEITFTKEGVKVTPLNVSRENLEKLQNNLMLFDTGIKRNSSTILSKQDEQYRKDKSFKVTRDMVNLADKMKRAIEENVDDVGIILKEAWQLKRTLVNGMSNLEIDDMYNKALLNGAIGGKLCGAGGGGFLLLYVKKENQEAVRNALGKDKELVFNFEFEGTTLI